jgi:Zn finger protein HypA/HybF involved in hydrogenase expression
MSHRPKSVYVTTCHKCGSEIQSETKEGACSNCHQAYRLEWGDSRDMLPKLSVPDMAN